MDEYGAHTISVKTYWRMHLYNLLREPVLLKTVEVSGRCLRFGAMRWDAYWKHVPARFHGYLARLKNKWQAHVASGCVLNSAEPYCRAYMDLLRAATEWKGIGTRGGRLLLARVLGLENFLLKFKETSLAFSSATVSFRNPVFLSVCCQGFCKNARNDSSLLALLIGVDGSKPVLFYHYRKQRILANTDESLLFFLPVDLAKRPAGFRGLEALTEKLVPQWDSRMEERSRLLAGKVLTPLLNEILGGEKKNDALRILDLGSGGGLFTGKLISAIKKGSGLGSRKVEASLLDILPIASRKLLRAGTLTPVLARVEYITGDYLSWLCRLPPESGDGFDIVFLCRILHNMSHFRVTTAAPEAIQGRKTGSRYPLLPHLSCYYRAILLLFPEMREPAATGAGESGIFGPLRVFNPQSLVMPDGRSLVQRLAEISRGVLIEDGELRPNQLVDHMSRHALKGICVYDLSRVLRLSVNHVYWITRSAQNLPLRGEIIWPS